MSKNETKHFIWNALGSLSTALLSIVLLTIVSRFSTSDEADNFAFAYSLSHLFIVIGLFQVRNFQSTDILQQYSFKDYALLRFFSVVAMLIFLLAYIAVTNFSIEKSLLIIVIVLYRMTDAISDLFQGFFQQQGFLDIAGKSLFFRNILIAVVFFVSLFLTRKLLLSLIVLFLMSIFFVISWDFFRYKSLEYNKNSKSSMVNVITIFKETLPLFINGILIIAVFNQPKYVIDALFEDGIVGSGLQLTFNVLFTPVFIINLMLLFLRPLITEMAVLLSQNDYRGFFFLKNKLLLMMSAVSLGIMVASYFLGLTVLEIVFGISLEGYQVSFLVLMVGGVVISFATIFDNVLTTMRKQKFLVISYFLSFITSVVFTRGFILQKGIEGAAWSFFIAVTAWLLSSIVVYSYFVRLYKKKND